MSQHEHFLEQHDPERKDFQVDRIILFSDAVFAIAITLLIIEIKPPEIHHGYSTELILEQLHGLVPKFVAFFISFFVIAIYWRSHHRIFGFVTGYTTKLIRINNFFLLTIVFMPFSSAYFSENFAYNIPFIFYNINVALTGAINYVFIKYVFNPENGFIKHQPSQGFLHLLKARAISTPIFFAAIALLAMAGFNATPFAYFLLWPMFYILEKINSSKFKIEPAIKHKRKA